jgi:wyosine [tRNA(Phe)-imidazoG37] synthetase (radical SAM superfamily)
VGEALMMNKYQPGIKFLNIKKFSKENLIEILVHQNKIRKNDFLFEEIINALRNGLFVLNNAEINYIINNPQQTTDYIIFRYKFRFFPKQHRLESFPLHLLIEPSSICNIKCTMCFQCDNTFIKNEYMGMMSYDLFKKVVDEAVENNCRAITFAGRGEPLLNKEIIKFFEYTKDKFYDFKLNTNALLLTEKIARAILETGVTQLILSVDSDNAQEYENIRIGGKFNLLLENIKMFNRIRGMYSSSKTNTRICAVKTSTTFNEKRFLDFWSKYVDDVACVNMEIRSHTYSNSTMNYFRGGVCSRLWERIYIWWDGKCSPCDNDYKSILNIGKFIPGENSIKDVWIYNYEKLRKAHADGKREQYNPCDRCGIDLGII